MPQRVFEYEFRLHQNIAFWKVVSYCVRWCIWWKRNQRRFKGCEWITPNLKLLFTKYLLDWILALASFSFISLSDAIDHCNLRTFFFCFVFFVKIVTWELDCVVPIVYPFMLGLLFLLNKVISFIKKLKTNIIIAQLAQKKKYNSIQLAKKFTQNDNVIYSKHIVLSFSFPSLLSHQTARNQIVVKDSKSQNSMLNCWCGDFCELEKYFY